MPEPAAQDGPGPAEPPDGSAAAPDGSAAAPPGGAGGSAVPVDWARLPEPVRQRLAELAAAALSGLAAPDVPAALRPVARFAPAKRARLAAGPLLAALREAVFRAAVVEWAREHRPGHLDPADADPVGAAAAAVLLGEGAAGPLLDVARRADQARLRADRDAATARAERAEQELRRLRSAAPAAPAPSPGVPEEEVERLRRRLREQGARLRAALDERERAAEGAGAARGELERELATARAERDRERDRADAAERRAARAAADAEAVRAAAREGRDADAARLALLVDTVAGAAAGLRRELGLGASPAGPRPADGLPGATPPSGTGARVTDAGGLDRVLALPALHVVVDGYNVTKTGYPSLTLSAQRDRLVGQLGALAARTGAEVTAVFDGAAVVGVPAASQRGVRVLFSDPGVLADDVIRALVAAEPAGRPVLVATSDGELAASVRRRGAHQVPSPVLLARLAG